MKLKLDRGQRVSLKFLVLFMIVLTAISFWLDWPYDLLKGSALLEKVDEVPNNARVLLGVRLPFRILLLIVSFLTTFFYFDWYIKLKNHFVLKFSKEKQNNSYFEIILGIITGLLVIGIVSAALKEAFITVIYTYAVLVPFILYVVAVNVGKDFYVEIPAFILGLSVAGMTSVSIIYSMQFLSYGIILGILMSIGIIIYSLAVIFLFEVLKMLWRWMIK